MSTELIATLGAAAAILAFLWTLHRDMASLRERMSRLEGTVEVLTRFLMERDKGA